MCSNLPARGLRRGPPVVQTQWNSWRRVLDDKENRRRSGTHTSALSSTNILHMTSNLEAYQSFVMLKIINLEHWIAVLYDPQTPHFPFKKKNTGNINSFFLPPEVSPRLEIMPFVCVLVKMCWILEKPFDSFWFLPPLRVELFVVCRCGEMGTYCQHMKFHILHSVRSSSIITIQPNKIHSILLKWYYKIIKHQQLIWRSGDRASW